MKISIIIPTYNAEKHIKKCIDNLLTQSYKNFEIVVVNDASTDDTLSIIESIKDDKVKIINLSSNSGAYYARKTGIKNATGDYILFVDSDDYIENNALKNLVNYINKYSADIVRFRYITEPSKIESNIIFNNEKKPFFIEKKLDKRIVDELLKTNNLNNLWSMIVKKELITDDKIINRFSMGEDHIQACYIYSNANKILFVDDIYYHYCDNPTGTMKNIKVDVIKNNLIDLLYCNDLMHEIIKEWNVENEYYNLIDSRTFNAITDVMYSKLYSTNSYNREKVDDILFFLNNNKDYNNLKSRISNLKKLFLYNNIRRNIKKIIFNCYKKALYQANNKKIHRIGQFIVKVKNIRSVE